MHRVASAPQVLCASPPCTEQVVRSLGRCLTVGTYLCVPARPAWLQQMPYRLNEETGIIDYDMLEKTSVLFRPKLIVAGALQARAPSSSMGAGQQAA